MLRGSDVPTLMARVETLLTTAARSERGARGVLHVPTAGDPVLGSDHLRTAAQLVSELPSGSARPVIGPAVRFAKRVVRRGLRWYIDPIVEQQSRFNGAVLDLVERLKLHTERLATLETQQRRSEVAATDARLDGIRADLEAGQASGTASGNGAAGAGSSSTGVRPSTRRALAYRAFEDRHRGAPADIAGLLAPYVPLFSGCRRVLDLGCGRGEFLGVLRDAGVPAYGVDSDESMVEAARAQGLEVELGDAIAHLRQVEADSVDGIFSSQVAEHLDTETLLTMLELAHRKLAPGGIVVIETPNPESLFIFAAFFYVDLTHIRPIHPEAMRWALEATGFGDVRIQRILPVPDGTRLEALPEELATQPGWSSMAANVERLNNLLYGPQHFAAIATKSAAS